MKTKNVIFHTIMWSEHIEMKENKKKLLKLLSECDKYDFQEFLNLIDGAVILLWEQFGAHTQKEENILYIIVNLRSLIGHSSPAFRGETPSVWANLGKNSL